MKRAVLASGTLYLSSPLPVERGNGLIKALEAKVQELGQSSLRTASVPVLIQALKECNVNTMWIQEEPDLENWETRLEQVDELMIGDTEYEVCSALKRVSRNTSSLLTSCSSLSSGATALNSLMERPLPPHSRPTRNGAPSFARCTKW